MSDGKPCSHKEHHCTAGGYCNINGGPIKLDPDQTWGLGSMQWHTRFAFLPTKIGERHIWLRKYRQRTLKARDTGMSDAAIYTVERICDALSLRGEETVTIIY